MIVQEHLGWADMPSELQDVDKMLTHYINKDIPPIIDNIFDDEELRIITAYSMGQPRAEICAESPLAEKKFWEVYNGIFEKTGVQREQAVVYRACANGIVRYELAEQKLRRRLSPTGTILIKARIANYSEVEIEEHILPNAGRNMSQKQRRRMMYGLRAIDTINATRRTFEYGMCAPDVKE